MEHESLQCDSVALQTWPNTNLSTCCFFFDPSLGTLVWASVCILAVFLTRRAVTFHPTAAASSSSLSLIFWLSLHNSGDQSPVAMAMKPPMQVYVRVCVFLLHADCTCSSPVGAARPPPVMLLSCTAPRIQSGFDSCLVEMLSPATLGFLSALCRIMTKIQRGEKNTQSAVRLVLFLSS